MTVQPVRLGAHGTPALLSVPEGVEPRSIVIILPGGGLACDKRWAADWLPLEALPVLRAYVDLPIHGERIVADLRERYRNDGLRGFFGPAVLGMAAEIPSIIDDLLRRVANPSIEKVALCGWSIGGLAAFLAAVEEERVGALAGFAIPCGDVDSLRLKEAPAGREERAVLDGLDLVAKAGRLYPKPVLLMHGTADTWLSIDSSRRLYDVLRPAYASSPERLRYVEFGQVPHDPLACGDQERKAIAGEVHNWLGMHLLGGLSAGVPQKEG